MKFLRSLIFLYITYIRVPGCEANTSCLDSTESFPVLSIDGLTTNMRTCAWAGLNNTPTRCERPEVSSACPVTCSDDCVHPSQFPSSRPSINPSSTISSNQDICVDSTESFPVLSIDGFFTHMRTCAWAGLNNTPIRCDRPEVRSACPVTCSDDCVHPSQAPTNTSPAPSSRPSINPSKSSSTSTSPSMSASNSSSNNNTIICVDSIESFPVLSIDGLTTHMRTCAWAGLNNTPIRCQRPEVSSACPVTCSDDCIGDNDEAPIERPSSNPLTKPLIAPSAFPSISTNPSSSAFPSSAPNQEYCMDKPNWVDSHGDGCDWYEKYDTENCPNEGKWWDGGDGSGNDSCCWCGGGIRSTNTLASVNAECAADLSLKESFYLEMLSSDGEGANERVEVGRTCLDSEGDLFTFSGTSMCGGTQTGYIEHSMCLPPSCTSDEDETETVLSLLMHQLGAGEEACIGSYTYDALGDEEPHMFVCQDAIIAAMNETFKMFEGDCVDYVLSGEDPPEECLPDNASLQSICESYDMDYFTYSYSEDCFDGLQEQTNIPQCLPSACTYDETKLGDVYRYGDICDNKNITFSGLDLGSSPNGVSLCSISTLVGTLIIAVTVALL